MALIFRTLGSREYLWAALGLAFTPVVFIHSTDTLDYVWSLAFMLVGQYFALRGRPLASGVSLGLAVGCRITAGAALLPTVVMLAYGLSWPIAVRRVAQLTTACMVTSVLVYLPVVAEYGRAFLAYSPSPSNQLRVFLNGTSSVWGVVGFVAVCAAVCAAAFQLRPHGRHAAAETAIPCELPTAYLAAWLLAGLVFLVGFLVVPTQAGYLIPIVPLVLLVLARFLRPVAFRFLCAALILSPLVLGLQIEDDPGVMLPAKSSRWSLHRSIGGVPLVLDPVCGPMCAWESSRLDGLRFMQRALAVGDTATKQTVVVIGQWMLPIQMLVPHAALGTVFGISGDAPHPRLDPLAGRLHSRISFRVGEATYVVFLDQAQLADAASRGERLYVLRGQETYDQQVFGADLVGAGAEFIR